MVGFNSLFEMRFLTWAFAWPPAYLFQFSI